MSSKNVNITDLISTIAAANRILVASHVSPDSDAFGSSIGLTLALRQLGKEVVCFNADGPSERYRCIPDMHALVSKLPNKEFDLTIICDCGAANRLGDSAYPAVMQAAAQSINIDHHISNSYFATFNYVVPASSTAEIIYQIIEAAAWPINAQIATALLAGMYGDTGGFRYSSTTAETFRVAGKLIAAGAVPHEIAGDLFSRKPIGSFKLQALVNSRATLLADGAAIYGIVHPEDYLSTGTDPEETEGFVEGLRDIDGVKLASFIYWHSGLWKVSLRSKTAAVNVSELAQKFGGGGHAQAAAFRFRKSLDELLAALLPEIERVVKS